MELHPFDRVGAVSQTHDESIRRLGGNLQPSREGLALDDEAMVTVGIKGGGEIPEDSLTLVMHQRRFTMHWLGSTDDLPAIDLPDGLVSQADSQRRDAWPEGFDNLAGYTRLVGSAWPR